MLPLRDDLVSRHLHAEEAGPVRRDWPLLLGWVRGLLGLPSGLALPPVPGSGGLYLRLHRFSREDPFRFHLVTLGDKVRKQ